MPKFIQTKIIKRQSKSLALLTKQKTVICTKMLWIQRYFSERITYMKLLKTGLKYFEVCFLNLIKTQMSLDKGSKNVKLKNKYKFFFLVIIIKDVGYVTCLSTEYAIGFLKWNDDIYHLAIVIWELIKRIIIVAGKWNPRRSTGPECRPRQRRRQHQWQRWRSRWRRGGAHSVRRRRR